LGNSFGNSVSSISAGMILSGVICIFVRRASLLGDADASMSGILIIILLKLI
jgi:hypothetical protein